MHFSPAVESFKVEAVAEFDYSTQWTDEDALVLIQGVPFNDYFDRNPFTPAVLPRLRALAVYWAGLRPYRANCMESNIAERHYPVVDALTSYGHKHR